MENLYERYTKTDDTYLIEMIISDYCGMGGDITHLLDKLVMRAVNHGLNSGYSEGYTDGVRDAQCV